MKKRMLSLLMALCLMLSLAPAALAVEADTATNPITVTTAADLADAVAEDATYDLVTLGSDITLSGPLTVEHTVTIDGGEGKHSITYDGGETDYAIMVGTGVTGVTLKNLTITAPNGVNVWATGATIDSCDINAYRRGINFYIEGTNSGATLNVTNCNIVNTRATDIYGVYYDIDNRGIATGNITNGAINIAGGSIVGFKYGINPVVDPVNDLRNGNGTKFNVTGTEIWGWTALNIWSAKTTYTFTDCTLVGVNKFDDALSYNDYATIMANDGICGGASNNAPVVNIVGGTIAAVRYGASNQAAVYVDANRYVDVNFKKSNGNKVVMNLFGTENYPAASFMFQQGTSTSQQNLYILWSGYNTNVTATNLLITSTETIEEIVGE